VKYFFFYDWKLQKIELFVCYVGSRQTKQSYSLNEILNAKPCVQKKNEEEINGIKRIDFIVVKIAIETSIIEHIEQETEKREK
jgi:hypothetical protein